MENLSGQFKKYSQIKNFEELPQVSIIVAVRNEEKYIKKCLDSLVNQNYPKDKYEIIVVDGMSNDGTRKIILEFQEKYQNLRLWDNPKLIYPSALNIGIKQSKGDVIIKVDAHVRVAKDLISKNVEYLKKTGAVCVGGQIKTIGEGLIGKAIALVLSSFFGTGGAKFRSNSKYEGYTDTVPFGAYRKKVFDEVGLYDEKRVRTEDLDLHARIRKRGEKIFITPKIKSYYYCRSSLPELIKQSFSNGYEVITALHAISLRHLTPFCFVAGVIISLILSPFFFWAKILFVLIFGSYILLNLLLSLKISFKNGFKYFLILPIIFFLHHFSYGIGSIWRLLTFYKIQK